MKKILLFLLAGHIALFAAGCGHEPNSNDAVMSKEESLIEESYISDSESIVTEESRTAPEEIYEFLKSKYKVVSKREAFETVYICEYYLVDGAVAGAKLMTTFPTEESANVYYNAIIEDYPHAELDELTVTHYLSDDEDYYYGYTLEKLKFVLEKADYEVSVEFDEELFEEDISTEEESE